LNLEHHRIAPRDRDAHLHVSGWARDFHGVEALHESRHHVPAQFMSIRLGSITLIGDRHLEYIISSRSLVHETLLFHASMALAFAASC